MKVRIDKRLVRLLLSAAAVSIGILVLFALIQAVQIRLDQDASRSAQLSAEEAYGADTENLTYYNGSWYAMREGLETALIIGLDKYQTDMEQNSYSNPQQSDFLLLLIVDHNRQTYTALHLNRDTMTEIPILGVTGESAGSFTGQLALAHTYGSGGDDSCKNTVHAVSNLLYGLEIKHYLSVTMDAVAQLNDLVGGVTVEVLDNFSGIDSSLIQGEMVTLSGEQALTYTRTRYGLEDSSNLRRMERQRQYLSALETQVKQHAQADENFLVDATAILSPYLVSDYTAEQISQINNTVSNDTSEGIYTLDGQSVQGETYMEFYPDETALQDMVIRLFYERQDMG